MTELNVAAAAGEGETLPATLECDAALMAAQAAALALQQEKIKLWAAGERKNTQRSYESDLRHFEIEFGGRLPASPAVIENYLTIYSRTLSPATLQRRLAALADYHRGMGYIDPTKTPAIAALLKGIRTKYQRPAHQARALDREVFLHLVRHTYETGREVQSPSEIATRRLVALRDRLFFLIGYQCALRSDELVRLRIEQSKVRSENKKPVLELFLPYSKGDRDSDGRTWILPAMSHRALCPVSAWQDWVEATGLFEGEVFRAIDRWGYVSDTGLHINSVIKLMRSALESAGVDEVVSYSSHSLRRGFATAWNEVGGDLRSLMAWVGWKNAATALKYQSPRRSPPALLMQHWLQDEGVQRQLTPVAPIETR